MTNECNISPSESINSEQGNNGDIVNYLVLNNTEPISTPAGLVIDSYINPFPWDGDEELYVQIYKTVDFLILEYKMRVKEADFPVYQNLSTEICKVGAKVLYVDANGDREYKFISIVPFDDDLNNYVIEDDYQCIDREDWEHQYFDVDHDQEEFVEFRFKVSYSDFENIYPNWEPYVSHSGRLINLCPVVFYSSNGPLDIDYVGVTDSEMERIYDDEDSYVTDIIEACNEYTSLGITKFSGRDEPFASSFPAHKRVKEILEGQGANLFQSVCSSNFWDAYRSTESDYHLINNAFNTLGETNQIMPQSYPASATWGGNWSEVTDSVIPIHHENYFQNKLSIMLSTYREQKEECLKPWNSSDFMPIVQTYGHIDVDNNKWKTLLPPSKTQKAMAYLPLCYGADGIFYYTFETYFPDLNPLGRDEDASVNAIHFNEGDLTLLDTRNTWFQRALVNRYNASDDWALTNQYYAIGEANAEISVIGPIIKELTWNSDKTITLMVEPENLFLVSSASNDVSIWVDDPSGINGDSGEQHDNYYEGYQGFVDCSIYDDGVNDYFMLVNRRGNFPKNEFENNHILIADQISQIDTDTAFIEADPQVIHFEFEGQVSNNYALVDQYLGTVYNDFTFVDNLSKIDIEIGPGEAMLLEFRDIITFTEVTGIVTLANCFIANDISIRNSGVLNIGDNVSFGAHVDIILDSGAILNINGNNVIVGTSSNFTISGGSTLNINGTIKFENDSKISNYGELVIGNISSATLSQKTSDWIGIISRQGSTTIIQNGSTIENAEYGIRAENSEILVQDSFIKNCDTGIDIRDHGAVSSLDFISSTIELSKPNSIGINIFNDYENNNILIGGTEESKSYIYGHNRNGIGVKVKTFEASVASNFICENINFSNLEIGILNQPFRGTSHIVDNCSFRSCDYGIQLIGNGRLSKISNCDFTNNIQGINQNTSLTTIESCNFDLNDIGIDLANIRSFRHTSDDFIINNCDFGYNDGSNDLSIKCVDGSPYIKNCGFNDIDGITSVDKSLVDISSDANNIFNCSRSHLGFLANENGYSGNMLLFKGHNDFYTTCDWDFFFWGHDYDGSDIVIDANGNYRERAEFSLYDFFIISPPTIKEDIMDLYPNTLNNAPPTTRFQTALNSENDGNYEIAFNQYKTIIDEFIESEKDLWGKSLDKIYNLSFIINSDISIIQIYFESLLSSIPTYLVLEEQTNLQSLIKNYIKKCNIEKREYQAAADLVIERIDNPISPVDSLFAVMQLEAIYVLSENDSLNRSAMVNTKFNHIAPKSVIDFNKKKENHWNEIYALLGISDETEENYEQYIPTIPTLYNNYPNPFNPETTISFSIPAESDIKISIYNIKGQKVKDLINNSLEKGNHNVVWYSKDNLGKLVSSGVYFYQLEVNGKTQDVRKCLLLK